MFASQVWQFTSCMAFTIARKALMEIIVHVASSSAWQSHQVTPACVPGRSAVTKDRCPHTAQAKTMKDFNRINWVAMTSHQKTQPPVRKRLNRARQWNSNGLLKASKPFRKNKFSSNTILLSWPKTQSPIDLFSLYVLLSHFRPRDATRGNSFFQMLSYARANVRITNENTKGKFPWGHHVVWNEKTKHTS